MHFPQALGIPFTAVGAAEKQEEYRKVITANHGSRLQHLYETLEDMLQDRPCTLHGESHQCRSCPVSGVSLALTGSPCNPFSTQRRKRFHEQSVSEHSMTQTTMSEVVQLYKKWEPRAAIAEQVRGFDMRTSNKDPETPCSKQLCLNLLCFGKGLLGYPLPLSHRTLPTSACLEVSEDYGRANLAPRRVLVRETVPGCVGLDQDWPPQDTGGNAVHVCNFVLCFGLVFTVRVLHASRQQRCAAGIHESVGCWPLAQFECKQAVSNKATSGLPPVA